MQHALKHVGKLVIIAVLVIVLLLLVAMFIGILPLNVTESSIRAADTGANTFCPGTENYHADAANIFKNDLGLNTLRLQCGIDGDCWGINMINNAANDAWADNLNRLLSATDSMGLKVYFYSLGDPWGGELGINDQAANITSVIDINTAKSYIDKLAGHNKLNHDFITDPRIALWSVANEAYIGTVSSSGVVTTNSNYQWIIQMCDYIRSKGGKVVVPQPIVNSSAYDGNTYNTAFKWTVPLLQGHVDYIEGNPYGIWQLVTYYSLGNQQYNWTGWEKYEQGTLQEMVNDRGTFPVSSIIVGEFGMWRGTGTDAGLTNWYFSDENRRDYYTNIFQAINNVGIPNLCFHTSIEEGRDGVSPTWTYGVIAISGQPYPYAADIIKQNFDGARSPSHIEWEICTREMISWNFEHAPDHYIGCGAFGKNLD